MGCGGEHHDRHADESRGQHNVSDHKASTLDEDHISIRWNVRTISVARTLRRTTEIGAFIEEIPLG